jgi:transposase IS166 family protein
MHLDLARLPDDAALLQQVVRDLASVLDRQTAELDDTKARLSERDAEIEKLQLFLAALRRQRFGRSSEKSHPDQLALSLEAIEEQIAALEASAIRRRRNPRPIPARSRAAGRCPAICHARSAGTSPTAAAAPAAAVRCTSSAKTSARSSTTSRRSSRWSATSGGASPAGGARAYTKCRCRRCRSNAAGRGRACSPTCSSPSIAIIFRSTGNRRSTPARASISTARPWPSGSAGRPGCCSRWPNASPRTCSKVRRFTPTTRRCQCSIPAAAARRPADCGSTSATTGRAAMRARRRRCSSTRPTAGANGRPITWPASGASCRPPPIPGLTSSTASGSSRWRAGRTRGARSSTSTRAPNRRLPPTP